MVHSSTYLYSGKSVRKSLTIRRKNKGPSFVPCGTTACTCFQGEKKLLRHTRCFRLVRKLAHQLRSTWDVLNNCSLCRRIVWSMRSNAFEKSIRQELITVFGGSVAFSQWWIRWTRAWVVDEFLTHPYWYGSLFGIMIAASHSKTKPSRILLSTGVNEIGLKSLLMDVGRGTLFIGITLAHFHRDGS